MRWGECSSCGLNSCRYRYLIFVPFEIRDRCGEKYHINCYACKTKVQQAWHAIRRPTKHLSDTESMNKIYRKVDEFFKNDLQKWKKIQTFLNSKESSQWTVSQKKQLNMLIDSKPSPKTLIVRVELVKPIPAPRKPRRPTPAPRTIIPYRPIPAPRNR
tara:strand:+ start:353 stop:826 length:474 start_codon:yes stop_codon:yes gene_type:complete